MRMNRLVYLPIGGALGAALLASAFVLPEAQLTAAQDCYGPCATTTDLALSGGSVAYGKETDEKFTVTVSSKGSEPTGTVDVESGTKSLCTVHLAKGKGDCALDAAELPPGDHKVVAHYTGNSDFKASSSDEKAFTVDRGTSATDLSRSKASVTDGKETGEKFTVTVSAKGGDAAGTVDVEADSKSLCTIHLAKGKGDCSLKATELKAGDYKVTAHYAGDDDFGASTSSPVAVKVEKR